MQDSIKVVIADNQRLYRQAIGSILGHEDHIKVVGEASNEAQTVFTINDLKPDIALIGMIFKTFEDLNFITPILDKSPQTKPILLTDHLSDTVIFRGFEIGIRGYISKDAGVPDLVKAIHSVHQGELWAGRKLIAKYFEEEAKSHSIQDTVTNNQEDRLTSREIEVIRLLTTGCSNKEIGQRLFISETTVKSHLNRIFKKLKVTRRIEATLYAIHKGWC